MSKARNIADSNLDDLTVDTDTLHVDSTNDRVGIGTTSPTRNLHVNSGTGDVVARFESTDADAYVNFVSSGGEALVGSSGNDLVFYPAGTEEMRVTDSGNLLVGGTTFDNGNFSLSANGINVFDNFPIVNLVETGGNTSFYMGKTSSLNYFGTADAQDIIFLTNDTTRMRLLSGGGLAFNSDTAAANALDDYEEGTFSFTWNGGGSVTTYYASYTKIGNVVTINCDLLLPSSSSTTEATISGFPFNITNSYAALAFSYNNKNTSYVPFLESGDDIKIRTSLTGGRATCANLSAGRLIFNGTVRVN